MKIVKKEKKGKREIEKGGRGERREGMRQAGRQAERDREVDREGGRDGGREDKGMKNGIGEKMKSEMERWGDREKSSRDRNTETETDKNAPRKPNSQRQKI